VTSGSASEPNSRTTPSPRDPQVARGPLAVVRPTASAVEEFGSETSDPGPIAASKNEGDGDRDRKPLGPTPPPPGAAYLASAPNGASPWSFVNVKWVSAIVGAGLVTGLVWTLGVPAWRARSIARLTIESAPPGADVLIDDRVRGTTPLELELPAGPSKVVVRSGRNERVLSFQLKGGDVVRQLIELAPAATSLTTGTLEVTSEPTRVALLVDGVAVGATPLSATTLAAGEHVLSARFPSGAVERRVRVEAGRSTTLHVVSPSATGDSIVGWLNVDTPLAMRIFEEGRLLGTTDVNRVMLPVGTHALHFVSDETGFETDRTVTVSAGRPTALRIETPTATLSVNARPWAEVFIDGERIGETPIGNLSRPIGRHEVVLRHPELGERRQTVVLTTRAPSRVSVDFQARTQ
jgi:hypothetical protein